MSRVSVAVHGTLTSRYQSDRGDMSFSSSCEAVKIWCGLCGGEECADSLPAVVALVWDVCCCSHCDETGGSRECNLLWFTRHVGGKYWSVRILIMACILLPMNWLMVHEVDIWNYRLTIFVQLPGNPKLFFFFTHVDSQYLKCLAFVLQIRCVHLLCSE